MAVVATAGHVDHGKSALVRALTGIDPDRLEVEQRRGLTIELGFAHVRAPSGRTIGIVDVPGHIDFINTMISGVGAVAAVMLIVDAVEGPRAQTAEHLDIVAHLGAHTIVPVITRADLVDDDQVECVAAEIADVLALRGVDGHVPVVTSAVDGRGIAELIAVLDRAAANANVADRGRPRLFVDRVFSIRGAGTVVTGTLSDGGLRVGDRLAVGGSVSRVRGIQHHGADVADINPGERVAVNLADVGVDEVARGDVLVEPDRWHHTDVVDAEVHLDPATPSTVRGALLHVGTARRLVAMRPVGSSSVTDAARQVRLRYSSPLPLLPGDRFVLRDPGAGRTIGGGVIRDVAPRRRPSKVVLDDDPRVGLAQHGWLPVADAERFTGMRIDAVVGDWFAVDAVVASDRARLDNRVDAGPVDVAVLTDWERALIADLPGVSVVAGAAMRGADPVLNHPIIDEVALGWVAPPPLENVDRAVVARLIRLGVFVEHDGVVFHADTLAALTPVLEALWAASPEGFTVGDLRTALGITRKHAMPLAACLDAVGMTRRVGDRRLPRHT